MIAQPTDEHCYCWPQTIGGVTRCTDCGAELEHCGTIQDAQAGSVAVWQRKRLAKVPSVAKGAG